MNLTKPRLDQFKITGSTVGDVYFPQTKLLLPFDGTNGATSTSDSSNSNHTVTFNGDAQISTAQSKWGGSSLYLDGSDSLSFADHADWTFGTGDFTIEFWVRFSNLTGAHFFTSVGDSSGFIRLRFYSASGWQFGGTNSAQNFADTLSTDTWYHVAFVRTSGVVKVFRDGTQKGSDYSNTTSIDSSNGVYIGRDYSNTNDSLNGYMDSLRVTKGVARYTSNFTPPTTAHLTSAGDVNKQIIINSAADGVAIGTGGINQARIAKAWCKFTGTGTAAIDESYNVSSITDRGTGLYSVTFSTAMSNSDYSFTATTGSGADSWVGLYIRASTFSTTVATFTISYVYTSSNGGGSVSVGYNDGTDVSVVVFGN